MSVIRSLIVALQAQTTQFEQGMGRAKKEIQSLSIEAKRGGDAISTLEKSLLTTGAAAAASLVSFQAIKSGLSSMIKEGERVQNLTRAFTAVTGSAENAKRELRFVSDLANRLGTSTASLSNAYKGLAAATRGTNLEGDKTREVFTAVAQAGRTLGLTTDEMNGSLLAIQQMMSKGKVSAEELRGQLGERLPGAFQIAARAMGVSTAELSKMLEMGQVISEDFLPKFARQLQRELGQGTEQAISTATQGWDRLGNAMGILTAGPGQKLSTWLGDILTKMANVVIEAKKVDDALNDIARNRASASLGRVGLEGVAENDPRRAKLVATEGKLLATEKELAELRKTGGSGARFEMEVQRLERIITLQKQIRENILENIRLQQAEVSGKKLTEKDFEPSIDPTAIADANQRDTARRKNINDAIDETIKAGMEAEQRALAIGETAADALAERLKVIQKGLEDILKKYPELIKGGTFTSATPSGAGAFAGLRAGEEARIRAGAQQYGVPENALAALRRAENGRPGREFGVLSVPAPTFDDQMRIAAQTFRANETRFRKATGQDPRAAGGANYTPEFYRFFSSRYAPSGAENDPTNLNQFHAQNLIKFSGAGGGMVSGAGVGAQSPESQRLQELIAETKELTQTLQSRKDAEKEASNAAKEALEIDKLVAQTYEHQGETLNRYIEKLQDSSKAISEEEAAKIANNVAQIQGFDASKMMIDSLLEEHAARRDVAAFMEREKELSKELAHAKKEEAQEYERVSQQFERIRSDAEQALENQERELARAHEEIGRTTLDVAEGLIDAARRGGDAWTEFFERVAQGLLDMAIQKSGLEQKLGEWLMGGVGDLGSLFGGGGSGVDAAIGAAASLGGSISGVNLGGMAEGGPIQAHMPYLVGEKGPEIIVPNASGVVLPNDQSQGKSMPSSQAKAQPIITNITMNITTRDANSFQRSRAEVQRSMVMALQAAQRSA